MKKLTGLLLCLLLVLGMTFSAQASGLTVTDSADLLEQEAQFPFLAETDELAVNVREDTSTKSAKVGRLERGTQLTVTGAQISASGELWYAVELANGTQGFIRSDLLVRSEIQSPIGALIQSIADGVENKAEDEKTTFRAKPTQASVNVRKEASTRSDRAGKISRGEILTVLSQMVNADGETWYAVQLDDGTKGYIRSDLLIETDEMPVVQASYQGIGKKSSGTTQTAAKSGSGSYIGNKNSKKFHRTNCRTLPKESNRVYFSSRSKAVSSGYVPCKNCDP